jgi:sugar phosphate isomerase/epimerase
MKERMHSPAEERQLMKLAFTTLACPAWDLDTIITRAVEYGYQGVDFRGYLDDVDITGRPEFTTRGAETARRIVDAGLVVPCFSTSCLAFCPSAEAKARSLDELQRYAELCRVFNAPYLRVFGGGIGDTSRPQAVSMAAAVLTELAEIAATHDLTIVLETHDDWTSAMDLRALIAATDADNVAVLWDTHHPYRMNGETPEETCRMLGTWIQYTHWKDSAPDESEKSGHRLCLFGDGDLPLKEMVSELRSVGYDGWLTLEWEKRWHADIEEPEVALPRYVEVMNRLIAETE